MTRKVSVYLDMETERMLRMIARHRTEMKKKRVSWARLLNEAAREYVSKEVASIK